MSFRFLVVDDSSIVRKVVKKVLNLSGINLDVVLEAENGKEALEVLSNEWVDLVFLDINMPVMNGIEFLKKMREIDEIKNTSVVVISTEGSKARKQELKELDVIAYLRKPVTPEKIVDMVKDVLGVET